MNRDIAADIRKDRLEAGVEADPYGRYTLDEFLAASLPEPDPIVHGVLPMGATMMVGGQHKVGKTLFMSQLAMCVAGGVPWLGFDTTPTRVLFLNYEVAAWSYKKRLEKQFIGLQRHGVTDAKTLARIRSNFLVESLPDLRVNKNSDLQALGEYAKRERVGLIILDPIRGAFQGNRNEDATVDRVMQALLDLVVKPSGAGILMGHHLRKPPSGEQVTGSTWDLKGSSGFADAVDGIVTLRRDPKDHSTIYTSYTLRHYESPDDQALVFQPASLMFTTSSKASPRKREEPEDFTTVFDEPQEDPF